MGLFLETFPETPQRYNGPSYAYSVTRTRPLHLVNNLLVEAEGDVRLQGDGHPLEQGAEAHALVPLPDVFIVAGWRDHMITDDVIMKLAIMIY